MNGTRIAHGYGGARKAQTKKYRSVSPERQGYFTYVCRLDRARPQGQQIIAPNAVGIRPEVRRRCLHDSYFSPITLSILHEKRVRFRLNGHDYFSHGPPPSAAVSDVGNMFMLCATL